MFHLLSLLASILTGLRKAVAHVSPRSRAHIPVLTPPLDHINHLFACFERLYADWCNGTLPEPRERAALPVAGVARLSRPVLRDPASPDPILPNTAMTAPRTPTPPPSSSPHPPLRAPCVRSAGSSASTCRPPRSRPPRKTRLSPACRRTTFSLRFSTDTATMQSGRPRTR